MRRVFGHRNIEVYSETIWPRAMGKWYTENLTARMQACCEDIQPSDASFDEALHHGGHLIHRHGTCELFNVVTGK